MRYVPLILLLGLIPPREVDGPSPSRSKPGPIDATTMTGKVICGYQGWFRCPGDPSGQGWRHWSRTGWAITPGSLTFEMWPDTSEFGDGEAYPAPGFAHADGRPASLFSSDNPATVARHFDWMERYGIDGVFLQRFLVNLGDPSFDRVLDHVRDSAGRTGRIYCIGYDLTGMPTARIVEALKADWSRLVGGRKVTGDGRYLRHRGKPVVFVWGLYSDRFPAEVAHKIIDIFKGDGPEGATLIGGCPWYWRSEKDAEWARAYRRLDVISPWNVGNYAKEGGRKFAASRTWRDDMAEAKRSGIDFLPVIYPGFGWTHLMGKSAEGQTIPRLGGDFFWRQFHEAAAIGVEMAYVAMFDEVDEATAIFKVTNDPPTQATFATFEGLPTDWYLRLTGEGTRLIRGERANQRTIPIAP